MAQKRHLKDLKIDIGIKDGLGLWKKRLEPEFYGWRPRSCWDVNG